MNTLNVVCPTRRTQSTTGRRERKVISSTYPTCPTRRRQTEQDLHVDCTSSPTDYRRSLDGGSKISHRKSSMGTSTSACGCRGSDHLQSPWQLLCSDRRRRRRLGDRLQQLSNIQIFHSIHHHHYQRHHQR